mmetsp:Transcript_11466/g.30383  ORF Transcript_11466/g.30383 Transcript_11466/m.30383 type:complete len:230 (+) Transcript_11466:488-1177(+)
MHELCSVGNSERLLYLSVGRALFAVPDVLADGCAKKDRLLSNHSNMRAEVGKGPLSDLDPVHVHFPLKWRVKALDERDSCALSAPTSTHQSHCLAWLYLQGNALKNRGVRTGWVAEVNIFDHHTALQRVWLEPLVIRAVDERLAIDNGKNIICSFSCFLVARTDRCSLSKRHCSEEDGEEHLHQRVHGEFTLSDQKRAIPKYERKGKVEHAGRDAVCHTSNHSRLPLLF